MRVRLGFTKPKQPIFGFEMAGQVEAVGREVTHFRPGDKVVASRGFDFGCHAEYVTVAEQGAIARIPESLSYQTARISLSLPGSSQVPLTDTRPGPWMATGWPGDPEPVCNP
jgi:NADPH:quinone reductase-like Zn-dependent oxidoreductase